MKDLIIIGNCKFCGKSIYEHQGHYSFLEDIFCKRECLYNKIDERAIGVNKDTIELLEDFIRIEQREIEITETILKDETYLANFVDLEKRGYIIESATRIRNDSEGHIKVLIFIISQFKKIL